MEEQQIPAAAPATGAENAKKAAAKRGKKPEGTLAKPATPRAKTKTAAGAKEKLSKFDVDLLRLVSQGASTQFDLLSVLPVDPSEFAARVKTLANKKLLVRDAVDANILRLGIKGYNELHEIEEKKRKAKTTAAREQAPAQSPVEFSGHELPPAPFQKPAQPQQAPEPQFSPKSPQGQQNDFPKQGEPLMGDLSDLVKKYGPNAKQGSAPGNYINAAKAAKAAPENPVSPSVPQAPVAATAAGSGNVDDLCELCKSSFKVSASPLENNPKYGHCFCGAAYHKDCFEGLLEADAKCVRCGKRLSAALDRKSEDAVKKIKNAFD
ncbi:MAG: hypothetical protein WC792_05830 [Candidatus Micrarchaeia archaeon]|jgi:hypothetical protein